MHRLVFPKDFCWGVATASYQVEGAVNEGGRGECIWDTFSRRPGAVYAGESGAVACDQYHRYAEDVAIIKELGFGSYRFSIAWPRIIPAGTGRLNSEGIDYYRRLCDELHRQGISACATLYHWDLPQPLEDAGGWADRSVVGAFERYAKVCFTELGDVVDSWITINEPLCVAYSGYLYGNHAPGHRDRQKAAAAVHHVNMAHGVAVRAYRETGLAAPIGITWNAVLPRPATSRPEDAKAAEAARIVDTDVFMLPCLGKGYPELGEKLLGGTFPVMPGDLELIAWPIDFIGLNYYNEGAVSADENAGAGYSHRPFWQDKSEMGWPVTPGGLQRLLRWVAEVSAGAFGRDSIPIYITENGYAGADEVGPDGKVDDAGRIEYFKQHLAVCAELIRDGLNLKGYYAWSLLDNFEWAFGYTRRFGIVHVDYSTLKRTPKNSAYFLRDVIAGYGEW